MADEENTDQNNKPENQPEEKGEEMEQNPETEQEPKLEVVADGSDPQDELKAELEKAKSEYLYLRAEFDNYRKNVLKDREKQAKFGSEHVLRDFLNILDNFKLAIDIEVNNETIKSFEQGVRMIAKEFESTLERNGVTRVKSVGEEFNPEIHEALSAEESEEHSPGTVIREFKGAYKLHGKLLRPGQVIVAKEKTE